MGPPGTFNGNSKFAHQCSQCVSIHVPSGYILNTSVHFGEHCEYTQTIEEHAENMQNTCDVPTRHINWNILGTWIGKFQIATKCSWWSHTEYMLWLHPKCSLHVFSSYIARNMNHILQCSQDVFGSFQDPSPPVGHWCNPWDCTGQDPTQPASSKLQALQVLEAGSLASDPKQIKD